MKRRFGFPALVSGHRPVGGELSSEDGGVLGANSGDSMISEVRDEGAETGYTG